jgi:putative membrane protein
MSLSENLSSRESFYKRFIWIASVAVFGVVVLLSQLPKSAAIPSWAKFLPAMNAVLNALTTLLLLVSLSYIRKKNVEMHKKLNLAACALSTLFLLSYVLFHSFGVETKFPVDNPMRPLYLFILTSHIILAAVVFPLVLFTVYRGLTNQVTAHRKIVRWSYPIWLYVTVTGVIVYLMISPYYKF